MRFLAHAFLFWLRFELTHQDRTRMRGGPNISIPDAARAAARTQGAVNARTGQRVGFSPRRCVSTCRSR